MRFKICKYFDIVLIFFLRILVYYILQQKKNIQNFQ